MNPILISVLILLTFVGCSPGQPESGEEKTAETVEVPEWIPDYPASDPILLYASESPRASSGLISFSTQDGGEQVLEFFRGRLEESGFALEVTPFHGPDASIGLLTGHSSDEKLGITVTVDSGEDETGVVVNYSQAW